MPATAAKPSPNRILRDLEKLPFTTLDRLLPKIAALRASKHPLVMTRREVFLQKKIEAGLPQTLWSDYANLLRKRHEQGLTSREQARIERLSERIEGFNVEWLEAALELAKIRGQTLERLLKNLNIERPQYV